MNKEWLRAKTVVISGAGNGIGKYLSYDLVKKFGCRIIGIDVDEESLVNLKTNIINQGGEFEFYCFDAKVEANWLKFAQDLVEKNIMIDVLINATGQSPKFNNFYNYSHKETNNIMSINLYSCIFAIKALHNLLKKSRTPTIINLCCSSATMGIKGTSIYSASKSALKCYTEVLQQELDGFYVGLFILGLVKSNFWKYQEDVLKSKLNKRAMTVEDASKKIIIAINKRKIRAVIGLDAFLSDSLTRLMPHRAQKMFNKYLNKKKYRLIEQEK